MTARMASLVLRWRRQQRVRVGVRLRCLGVTMWGVW